MSIRSILIGADENGEGGVGIFRGTSVKDNPDYDTDNVPCFDEMVPQGNEVHGGTLEIEKLSYDSIEEYIRLMKQLLRMKTIPTMITTFQEIKFKGEDPYTIQSNYIDCLISGNDLEHKPNEKSVRSLKFTYGDVIEKVDGQEITLD